MDILNTKTLLALGLSGAMSVGTAAARLSTDDAVTDSPILSVSSPDLRVTVYDGIATLIGTASSRDEAAAAEQEILEVPGVEHVINLITWE
ncbi:MAG: BON domain-containing protein [Pseudomonadota bacterium]